VLLELVKAEVEDVACSNLPSTGEHEETVGEESPTAT